MLHGDRRIWGSPGNCRTPPLGRYFDHFGQCLVKPNILKLKSPFAGYFLGPEILTSEKCVDDPTSKLELESNRVVM